MGVNRLNPVQKATYFKKNQKWEKIKSNVIKNQNEDWNIEIC